MTKDEIAQKCIDENLAFISIGSHRSYNYAKQVCKLVACFCWDNGRNYYFVPVNSLDELLKIRGVKVACPREHITMCWGG